MLSNVNNIQIEKPEIKSGQLNQMDMISLFKESMINSERNCLDPITDKSMYCFNCKTSFCTQCAGDYANDHLTHLLLPRKDYLFFNESFFGDAEKTMDDLLSLTQKKQEMVTMINDCFNSLKDKLDLIRNVKLSYIDKVFKDIEDTFIELRDNYAGAKTMVHRYYKVTEYFQQINKNNFDGDNAIFLMNFEMMNLYDNKNIEAFDAVNKIYSKLSDYKEYFIAETEKEMKDLNTYDKEIEIASLDNIYWDIKTRCKTYIDKIDQFKISIGETIKDPKGMDRLIELLNIFNSKQKKGVNCLYNQTYFSDNQTPYENFLRKKELTRPKSRCSSKSPSKSHVNIKSQRQNNNNNNASNVNINQSKNNTTNNSFRASPVQISPSKMSQYMINLDNAVIQKLFSYSILDTFNKCFNNSNEKCSYNTTLMLNDYKTRDVMLKETAKPIVSTNEISIFNPTTNKLTKSVIKLEKQKHGYDKFPQGIRHILIENRLFITGGVDMQGKESSITISIDIKSLEVEVLNPLLVPRSYHSIEFINDYDCLLAIGGEENNSCELYDLFTKKWTRLPDLTYWRSNCNIYYDHITSDIYVLFGICSSIKDTNYLHSDAIEVLELKDISGGWIIIDYYKSVDFNLRMNYCSVMPLARDRLLIYGAANARMKKKCFGVFNTKTSEIVRISDQILEEVRNEDMKLKKEEEKLKA